MSSSRASLLSTSMENSVVHGKKLQNAIKNCSAYQIKIYSFFRTCKPTGDPLIKVTVCLTGKGNKKSLPLFQFVIVECGAEEFCEPVGYDEAAFGYIFLSF